mmetsp:Transcript_19293/g.35693  ORF Transcript_19293/g.35693 Transcript_19293/m.35693 type:complete len:321 (-) Transcript_19293:16-978(-)
MLQATGRAQEMSLSRDLSSKDASTRQREFEWLAPYKSLRTQIRAILEGAGFGSRLGSLKGLEVGGGSSGFARELVQDGVCSTVLSTDISKAAISFWLETQASDETVEWKLCDITSLENANAVMGDVKFDLVIDKGTMDALLCEDKVAGYFRVISQHLACDGAVLVVSLHEETLVRKLWSPVSFGRSFIVSTVPLTVSATGSGTLALIHSNQRRSPCPQDQCKCQFSLPDLESLKQHVNHALNWYHVEVSPLLSNERVKDIKTKWPSEGAPVPNAYLLLFSKEERSEYSLDDFTTDLNGSMPKHGSVLSIDDALLFLQENQ